MLARDWGRVIFIASDSARIVPPDTVHYDMTKTAQLAISRGFAVSTKGTRITVNAVLPGTTRSAGIVDLPLGSGFRGGFSCWKTSVTS